jgi:hypothetical protein
MSKPDIQYFAEDGTWVKPPGAVRADIVLQAGDAGAVTGAGPVCAVRGADGELTVRAIPADDLPHEVQIEIGRGGRPGGRDGYALIVTHLADEEAGQQRFTGGNGGWIAPPPITDCPVVGFAAVDDPAYDMCVCGRRHITVAAWGSGGPAASTQPGEREHGPR